MNLLFALLTACVSFAYIPEYSLIASHAADQHGKGSYLVEQDVTLKKDGEAFTVKETWMVNNEISMRVTLEGRGALKGLVQGSMVYEGAQRFFIDPTNPPTRVQRLGDDWLEPLFYFRSSKFLRNRLVTLKVAPAESLKDRPALPSEGEIKYEPPSYIRLSRVGGATAWEIGQAPATGVHPELWIEQDQFVVRKYRGGDQVVLRANDYNKYDDGFYFPRQRIYNFGNYTVEVNTLQVKSLGKLRPDDSRFKPAALTAAKDGLKLPDADGLREFYQRFR
jgi:hypothetical protein